MKRSRGSRTHLQEKLDEISYRALHKGGDFLNAFLRDLVRVHGTAEARSALPPLSSVPIVASPKYGCLCDEPVDKIPYYARKENGTRCVALMAALNMWKWRHAEHAFFCDNSTTKCAADPGRARQLEDIGQMRLFQLLSNTPARIAKKRKHTES